MSKEIICTKFEADTTIRYGVNDAFQGRIQEFPIEGVVPSLPLPPLLFPLPPFLLEVGPL